MAGNEKAVKLADAKYDQGKGFNFWWQILLFALCGQLCWNVENQWFALFLNRKITLDVTYTTAMTILSATLTCISTFLFGTLADRKGKRKLLMGLGYVIWGISTIMMGTCEWVANAGAIKTAALMVVLIDGIMSFIGSIAYDSSFNVWTNDHTTENNKGIVGAVLGIMPVIATIGGTVIGGAIIGDNYNYQLLFWCSGGFSIISGILALIFAKDKNGLKPHKDGTFIHQLVQPFNFKGMNKIPNFKELILACLVICTYFISFNFYFVYLGTWAVYRLGFQEFSFGVIEAVGMLLGVVVALILSKQINKDRIPLVCAIGLFMSYVGLMILFFFVKDSSSVDATNIFSLTNLPLILCIFFFGTGEILLTEACMIWVRGLFPPKNRGQFEGTRCIFFVWVPMLVGTLFGDFIIRNSSNPGVDVNNMPINIPNEWLFFWASWVVILTFIPLFFGWRAYSKRIRAKKAALAEGRIDVTLFDAVPIDKEGNSVDAATIADEPEDQTDKK